MPTNHPPTGPTTEVLRGLTSAGVLLSAVVHLDLYAGGFSTVAVIGPLFLLNAIAGLILGIAVLVWRHWVPAFLAAGFAAVTVIAYWYSVLFGLFGVREVMGGWSVILAEVAEYVALAVGLAVTWRLATFRRAPTARRAASSHHEQAEDRQLPVT